MKFEATSDRRRFFGIAAATFALLGPLARRAWAALPHLSVDKSATARALNYVEDASKAGAPHKPGQDCAGCVHFQGKAGDAWGPCALFPGFDVNAKGWCSGFEAKK